MLYAQRQGPGHQRSRGTISNVTAFATGSAGQSFPEGAPGYVGPAITRRKASMPISTRCWAGAASTISTAPSTMFADMSAEYRIPGSDFVVDGLAVAGKDDSWTSAAWVARQISASTLSGVERDQQHRRFDHPRPRLPTPRSRPLNPAAYNRQCPGPLDGRVRQWHLGPGAEQHRGQQKPDGKYRRLRAVPSFNQRYGVQSAGGSIEGGRRHRGGALHPAAARRQLQRHRPNDHGREFPAL